MRAAPASGFPSKPLVGAIAVIELAWLSAIGYFLHWLFT
jgi:hypothetical protein